MQNERKYGNIMSISYINDYALAPGVDTTCLTNMLIDQRTLDFVIERH